MKEILYNYDLLNDEDINKIVQRAKALIINSNNEILIGCSANNYQLPGGHLEEGETLSECLSRELLEETGMNIPVEDRVPFMIITYMNRDYPSIGVNSKYIANYYIIKTDQKPDLSKIDLTDNEKEGMFELKYIHIDKVLQELEHSLIGCSRKNVILDTIEVVKEYFKITNLDLDK